MATTSYEIDRQAADWNAKRDAGALSSEEEAAFQAWLAADVRNLGAYGRVVGTLARVQRAGGAVRDDVYAVGRPDQSGWPRRRIVLASGIAASVAVLAGVGGMLFSRGGNGRFSTGVGLVREVVLADGSVVTLNTNSEVSVKFTDKTREIHLLRGEALFDVAKNKVRPFIVFAGAARVRAVGTSFAVSMLPKRPIQVLVREGVVELAPGSSGPVRVSANTRVLVPHNDRFVAATVPQAKVTRDLAWQYGRIAFDNKTLREAADEFARYSNIRINVAPGVADRTITGLFAANDPVGFAKVTAAALELHVEVSDSEVTLSDRPEKKS